MALRACSTQACDNDQGEAPVKITVNGYSGFKLNERPRTFVLDGHEYQTEEILDQWYGPDSTYFKVRASDGNHYVLRYYSLSDEWSLESYRQAGE